MRVQEVDYYFTSPSIQLLPMKSKNKHCRWIDERWTNEWMNMVSELWTNSLRYTRRIKYKFHWQLLTIYMINGDYCWIICLEQMKQWVKIDNVMPVHCSFFDITFSFQPPIVFCTIYIHIYSCWWINVEYLNFRNFIN